MISKLRGFSNSKLAGVLVGIIIIPFVFWGMGSSFTSGSKNIVLKMSTYFIGNQYVIGLMSLYLSFYRNTRFSTTRRGMPPSQVAHAVQAELKGVDQCGSRAL